jgi:membrane protein YqaA with SNARE-associated domain
MSIINLLEQSQILELEKVTKELYFFTAPSDSFIHESLSQYKIGTGALGAAGAGAFAAIGNPVGALIGSMIGKINSKKDQPNIEKIENNIKAIEQERRNSYQVDSYIDNSISKVTNTDAFNILSGVVKANIVAEIGKIHWEKLENKSKLFLTTAEVLREFLEVFNNELDYSPPTLNYCKAVENELNQKLLFPFKEFFQSKKLRLKNSDYESKLSFILTKDDMKLTLGEHVYILRRILNTNQLTNIESEYKRFIMISSPSSLGRLNQKINIITKYYRNPSGHTEVMDQKQCLECRNYILTRNGVLPGILGNFKVIR